MASSFSIESTPSAAARAMPASSLTGMKAPERPPVDEVAMVPPFLTASFSMARAAVVPGAPVRARPMASRISATESPTAGEGASERSMMPICASSISAASRATSSPTRVILKVVRLIRSARSVNERSGWRATTLRMTPGPEMATLMLTSGSPLPCRAPAMKGLSSGTLQKVTILAQPMESRSAVRRETSSSTSAMRVTASMLMPARVEATLTDEQHAAGLGDGLRDGLDQGGVVRA